MFCLQLLDGNCESQAETLNDKIDDVSRVVRVKAGRLEGFALVAVPP